MAKKKKPDQRRRDLVMEALLLGALAVQALILVALVTYAPEPAAQTHLVGIVGHYVAWALWTAFGVVSFVLAGLGIFTTLVRLVRREIGTPVLRLVGGVLMLGGGCALVHLLLRPMGPIDAATAHPFDVLPGGVLGQSVFDALLMPFGAFGTLLFAVVGMCTGFAFATDWLVYEMLYDALRHVGRAGGVVRRFWPQPAIASAGAAAVGLFRRERDEDAKARTRGQAATGATATLEPPARLEPPVELTDPEVVVPPEMLPSERDTRSSKNPTTKTKKPAGADESALLEYDLEKEIYDADTVDDLLFTENDPLEEWGRQGNDASASPREDAIQDEEEEEDYDEVLPLLEVKLEPLAQRPQPAEVIRPARQGEYELPGLDLLDQPKPRDLRQLEKAIQENAEILQRTLSEFRVDGRVVAYQQGPVVTMLEVALAPGTKVTKIHALADDLAMALKVQAVRIVAPIPGKSTVGVEIPNPVREDVRLISLLESDAFQAGKQHVPVFLGMRADGTAIVEDLTTMPHLLLAGATGSGKSVCVNTVLVSILATRSPDEVKLILIDPKQVELAFFANIPHLLAPVVTDMKRASSVLEWAVTKMEERYDLLRRFEVRNIAGYNQLGEEAILERVAELGLSDELIPVRLPYIVIVVEELADLMLTAGREVEKLITRLAQKSRAVGIHIILATQRPSTDVITGLIKANMPTRIAFQVTSKVDSRVVLDQNGADKLLGMGDMLYLPPRSSSIARAQGTFVSDKEVKRVVKFLKDRYSQEFNDELVEIGTTDLLDEREKDNLYDEAVRIVLTERRGSASLLQRALAIGYTRASRLLDLMRKEGVVGAYKGSKASDVLLTLEQYDQRVEERRARTDE